jgi:hypothetical protein
MIDTLQIDFLPILKRYDYVGTVSDEFLTVGRDTGNGYKYGVLDLTTNKELIPLMYDKIGLFVDGIIAVQLNGLWGFINRKGEEVVEPCYLEVFDSREGWAKIKLITGKIGWRRII